MSGQKKGLRPYVVELKEVTAKKVVVFAEDARKAGEAAEELLWSGKIDMMRFSDSWENAEALRAATDDDLRKFDVYDEEDSK